MSLIVLNFLHSTSVLSFDIDAFFTLSTSVSLDNYQVVNYNHTRDI